jgi:hypothetical protein
MAMSPTTPLFPNLPPELRNEIYAYLSQPTSTSTATNSHLPLSLKTFSCKHTTLQLLPIHHGTTGLLSLPTTLFPEANEYASYLLTNGISLQISLHFKGRINTFVQSDWAKKTEAHLRKLVKSFPWLSKVARYDVQIFWEPVDGALKSKNGKRNAGGICLDMLRALTAVMDQEVKRKKSDVRVTLNLEHRFAVANALSDTKFGLNKFLGGGGDGQRSLGFCRLVREVRKAGFPHQVPRPLHPAFLPLETVGAPVDRKLIEIVEGRVRWSEWTGGPLVMRKTTGVEVVGCTMEQGMGEIDFPMCHLMAECVRI